MNALAQYKTAGANGNVSSALQQFEGTFIGQMLNFMFDTIPVDKNFGGGIAEENYKGMLVDEYSMNIAKNGGIGIASQIQRSIDIKNGVIPTAVSSNQAASSYAKTQSL